MTTSNTTYLNPALTDPLSTGTVKAKVEVVPLRDGEKGLTVWLRTIKKAVPSERDDQNRIFNTF